MGKVSAAKKVTTHLIALDGGLIWLAQRELLGLGITQFSTTFRDVRKFQHTLTYLALYFLYSDGFSTISTVGILYAQQEMCLSSLSLFIVALEVPLFGLIGSLLFHHLALRFKWSNKVTRIQIEVKLQWKLRRAFSSLSSVGSHHNHSSLRSYHSALGHFGIHQGLWHWFRGAMGSLPIRNILRPCSWYYESLESVD